MRVIHVLVRKHGLEQHAVLVVDKATNAVLFTAVRWSEAGARGAAAAWRARQGRAA